MLESAINPWKLSDIAIAPELKNSAGSNNKNDYNVDIGNDFNNIYELYRNQLFKICSNLLI